MTGESSKHFEMTKESNSIFAETEIATSEACAPIRVIAESGNNEHYLYQGSTEHIISESSNHIHIDNSSYDSHDFPSKIVKERSIEVCSSVPSVDHIAGKSIYVKPLERGSSVIANANKAMLADSPISGLSEANMLRNVATENHGKCQVSQTSGVSCTYENHQLKQMRAQCLVFLAFRNGVMPKKLHLEIALGNLYLREDESQDDVI